MVQFNTTLNHQNNPNFTGLHLRSNTVLDKIGINKIYHLLTEKGKFINKLEKEYNTDVFVSSDVERLEFMHRTYGSINTQCSESFPIDKFMTRKEEDILSVLKVAIDKTYQKWNEFNHFK